MEKLQFNPTVIILSLQRQLLAMHHSLPSLLSLKLAKNLLRHLRNPLATPQLLPAEKLLHLLTEKLQLQQVEMLQLQQVEMLQLQQVEMLQLQQVEMLLLLQQNQKRIKETV